MHPTQNIVKHWNFADPFVRRAPLRLAALLSQCAVGLAYFYLAWRWRAQLLTYLIRQHQRFVGWTLFPKRSIVYSITQTYWQIFRGRVSLTMALRASKKRRGCHCPIHRTVCFTSFIIITIVAIPFFPGQSHSNGGQMSLPEAICQLLSSDPKHFLFLIVH